MRKSILLLLTLCSLFATAQSKYSASALMQLSNSTQEITRSGSHTPDEYINVIMQVTNVDALANYGILVGAQAGNYVTARVPLSLFPQLGEIKEIEYIEAPSRAELKLEKALPDIGYNDILALNYTPTPIQGKGVVVGIVDHGVQWDHAAFRNIDGSTRIIAGWNQRDTLGNRPEPYGYGSIYTTQEEIMTAPACANNSHATHVASIAAGSAINDSITGGVAREATLVIVDLEDEMSSTAILDALDFIVKKAEELDMPCVVNLSLGINFGPHDGTSLMDRMMDTMQQEGVLFVGAIGNEAQYALHLGHDFDTDSAQFCTGFRLKSGFLPNFDAWSDRPVEFCLEMFDSRNDTLLNTTGWLSTDSLVEMELPFFDRTINAKFTHAQSPYNNRYNSQLELTGVKSIGQHYFSLTVKGTEGRLDMWANVPGVEFSNHKNREWKTSDYKHSLGEIGGTGKLITTVGSYTTDTAKNANVMTQFPLNDITPTSSRGYTIDGRMKPEIVAPGCIINAAFNEIVVTNYRYGLISQIIDTITLQDKMYLYGAMSGTSMASPMVAGTYALWLQVKPDLTPLQAKEILRQTARQDKFTTDSTASGYGKLDAYAGLKLLLEMTDVNSPSLPHNLSLYPTIGNGTFHLYTYGNVKPSAVYIYNTTGMLIASHSIENYNEGVPCTLHIPHAQQGIYYIQVVTNNGRHTYKYVCR